ncbi:MAG: SRPBCC family protein [Verrucomicrobium sp.]
MSDTIEKRIEVKAPVSRVWQAISDHEQFGQWFRVKLDGPFIPGTASTGHITYPGYEHLKWTAMVKEVVPEKLLSFTWHPYAIDPKVDYSDEIPTLVEFVLAPTADGQGTLLVVTESGFDKVPPHRRLEAFRMNEGGWEEQVKNIDTYVKENP